MGHTARCALAVLAVGCVAHAGAVGLRAREAARDRLAETLAVQAMGTTFEPVLDLIQAGSPARKIWDRVDALVDHLGERAKATASTCDAEISKAQKEVDRLRPAHDQIALAYEEKQACVRTSLSALKELNGRMSAELASLTTPQVRDKLVAQQQNLTDYVQRLTSESRAREAHFDTEIEKHDTAEGLLTKVIGVVEEYYSKKGKAPPARTEHTVVSLEDAPVALVEQTARKARRRARAAAAAAAAAAVKSQIAALVAAIKSGRADESLERVHQLLDLDTPIEEVGALVGGGVPDQGEEDRKKTKKVSGTMWNALHLLKNSLAEDRKITEARKSLHTEKHSSAVEVATAELEEIREKLKSIHEDDQVRREAVLDMQDQANKTTAVLRQCKHEMRQIYAEASVANHTLATKVALVQKTTDLCEKQQRYIEDEIVLGRHVLDVLKASVLSLHNKMATDTGITGTATGAAEATGATGAETPVAETPVAETPVAETGPAATGPAATGPAATGPAATGPAATGPAEKDSTRN